MFSTPKKQSKDTIQTSDFVITNVIGWITIMVIKTIHPFAYQSRRGAGAYPSRLRARGGVDCGQVASLAQG